MSISLAFFFSFFSLLSVSSYAFNITNLLSQHSEFSTFNEQLTQTQVASAINSRQTITVLAVDNSALSGLSGKSSDDVKKILSLHVILDFFDVQKFNQMSNKSSILTTLFQSTGLAAGQAGFLNATKTEGGVVFGSAEPGSSLSSSLMKNVVAEPYNISVVQVSSVIVPPNMGGNSSSGATANATSPSPTASPPKQSSGAAAPAPSNATKSTPPPSNATAPSPSHNETAPSPSHKATAPAPSNKTMAPSPSHSHADSPSEAHSPSNADSPSYSSPPKPDSPSESPAADAPAPSASDVPAADEPTTPPPTEEKKKSAANPTTHYNSLGLGVGALVWFLLMEAW